MLLAAGRLDRSRGVHRSRLDRGRAGTRRGADGREALRSHDQFDFRNELDWVTGGIKPFDRHLMVLAAGRTFTVYRQSIAFAANPRVRNLSPTVGRDV